MKRLLIAPGMVWLAAFFLVAFYAIVAVGLGNITDVYEPVPHWNPLDWNVGYLSQAIKDVVPGGRRGACSCAPSPTWWWRSGSRWRSATRSPTTSRATRTGS